MEKCDTCQSEFAIVVDGQIKRQSLRCGDSSIPIIQSSFCPICGVAQLHSNGMRAGMLRIGSHVWRVHIHPEFSKSDIEFWDLGNHDYFGKCSRLGQRGSLVVEDEARPDIHTNKDFGCINFAKNQNKPFRIQRDIGAGLRACWRVMLGDDMLMLDPMGVKDAQSMADALNDLWAQKEQKDETKKCANCGTYRPCPKASLCIVCDRWIPQNCDNCGTYADCFHRSFVTGCARCVEWSAK